MDYNHNILAKYGIRQADLLDYVRGLGVEPLLLCITGSHMWHTATDDSDLDIRGVYIRPTRDLLGLKRYADTIEAKQVCGKDIDLQLYELGKLYSMLLNHNGNVVEMLLSPTVFWQQGSWRLLYRVDKHGVYNVALPFLTKKLATYYTGYFHSQRKRAGQNRGGRALLYSYRELMAGTWLMKYGQIIYDFNELVAAYSGRFRSVPLLDKYRAELYVPQDDAALAEFEADWQDMLGVFQREADASSLPDKEPDWVYDQLDYKLKFARMARLGEVTKW